jgi:hypothetical protein
MTTRTVIPEVRSTSTGITPNTTDSSDHRSIEMYSLNEALAREHARELHRQSRHVRSVRPSERRHRLARHRRAGR